MYVVANLIDNPKQASVAVGHTTSGAISYRVHLAPDDVRRVVGKNGFTISAIRSLFNVAAAKYGVKVSLRVDGAKDFEFESAPRPQEGEAGVEETAG